MVLSTQVKRLLDYFPFILFLVLAPLWTFLDLRIEKFFFQTHFSPSSLKSFFYHYGDYPALITGISSGLLWLLSWELKSLSSIRKTCALLALVLILVNGITVTAMKRIWGRPRPVQTVDFGGSMEFRAFYQPNLTGEQRGKSFPSGHTSMGFYFFLPALLAKRRGSFKLTAFLFTFAWVWSGLLTYARLGQGAHYLSDALASGVLLWYSARAGLWLAFDRGSS